MNPESFALMIPIVAIVGGIGAGIVQTMAKHQRQMAEIMRGTAQNSNAQLVAEIQALRNEVELLKDRVNSAAIAADMPASVSPPTLPEGLAQRLDA